MIEQIPESAPGQERPDFETIVHMLEHAGREHPDHTAIISGDNEITYGDYYACAAGIAYLLLGMGAKGQRVVILKANSVETSVAAYGVWAAGAETVLFNPLYTERELGPLLKDASPKIVLCDDQFAEMLRPLADAAGVTDFLTFGDEKMSFDQWRGDRGLKFPEPKPKNLDFSMLTYTGGTTGLPKAAVHTHNTLLMAGLFIEATWPTEIAKDVWLNVAPQSHIWGWCMTLLGPVYGCNTVVIVPQFRPDLVINDLVRTKATIFAGGPSAIYNALLSVPNLKEADLSNLRLSVGGGSPFAEGTVNAWQAITGNTIYEGYGMSEGAPISLSRTYVKNKIGSVGTGCPLTEIEIVDTETGTKVLPTGEDGEIRVKGPQMVEAYLNRPEETAETIRDGWIHTGDIGHFDEEGYIFIVDRKKDMVIVGGYNVFPREVDEILFAHPGIIEAAAVGAPDEYKGEVIQAYVVLAPDATLTEEGIIGYCQEKLAKFKVPTTIYIEESLPKTPAAKIDKIELRKRAAG